MSQSVHQRASGMREQTNTCREVAGKSTGYFLMILVIVASALLCPVAATAQCDVTSQCDTACFNRSIVYEVEHDSVLNAATRSHRFNVSIDIQAIDTTLNGAVYGSVMCVAGGNGGGRFVKCNAGIGGSTGCVDCDTASYLDVAWCDSVVTFRLDVVTMNNNSTAAVCRCRFYKKVRIPSIPEEAANSGYIACTAPESDPVNAANGNLYLASVDVTLDSDLGIPIAFSRFYNSYSPLAAPDPTRMWSHSFDYTLLETSRDYDNLNPQYFSVKEIILHEGSGRAVKFEVLGNSQNFLAEAVESNYRLTYDSFNNEYTITVDGGTRLVFSFFEDLTYRLSEIVDKNDNSLELTWAGYNLTRVWADSARYLDLQYTTVNNRGVLKRILDAEGDTLVTYDYVDSTAFLKQVTFADGSWEQYTAGNTAESRRRIVQKTTSDGASWHYAYTTDHRVSVAYNGTSPDVEYTSFSYDTIAAGVFRTDVIYNHDSANAISYTTEVINDWGKRLLTEITDGACGVCGRLFTYDSFGNRTSVEYANGRVDSMKYDDRGNVDTLIYGAGSGSSIITTFEYDTTYNLPTRIKMASVAKPSGYRETVLVRDSNGNAVERIETGWLDTSTSYADTSRLEYNSRGQLTKIDGPRVDAADTIALRYDPTTSELLYAIFPNGDTITFGARDFGPGGIPYVFDPNGVKTSYAYDERGRISRILENALSADSAATDAELNFKGEIDSLTLPLGNTYSMHYNEHDWLTFLLNESGDSIAYGYDNMSHLTSVRHYDAGDQLRRRDTLTYNWKSQMMKHDGFEYRYDAMGWLDTIIVAALGDSTFLEYDQFGRVTEIVEVADDGSHLTTHLAYDIRDNLTCVTDPDSNSFYFWYDDRGEVRRDSCAVTGVTEYDYDASGNLITQTDANGTTVEFEYDALGRLTTVDYPDSTLDVTFEYDGDSTSTFARGRLTRESNERVAISYQYDAFGRVVEESHELEDTTYEIAYTYNKNGRIATATYPSGVEYTYSHDPEGRVSRVSARFGEGQARIVADSIQYEPFGAIKSILYGNDVKTNYSYDTRGLLTGISTGADSVLKRSYTYDTTGNILSYFDSLSTANNTSYSYDKLDRLVRVIRPSLAPDTIRYEYYDNGNRHMEIVGEDTTAYAHAENRLTSLSGATAATFAYDDNGNLTLQVVGTDTTEYGYDEANQLISVTQNDTTCEQTYNSRGQRLSLTTPGGTSRYVYAANGLLLTEYLAGDWATDYVYLYGQPIARVWAYNEVVDTTTVTHFDIGWYHNEHLGTPLTITDSAKTVRWSAQYYPFGELASENVSVQNNLRLPGQYHDRSTDLYYNMFRTYQPSLGRYLTPDPIGLAGGMNLYGYAGGNPINYTDPMGLDWWSDFGHGAAQFAIGFGDVVSLGITKMIRHTELYGGDYYTDVCSNAYRIGEWGGVIASTLTGVGGGMRVSLTRATKYLKLGSKRSGLEFSHWIPQRWLKSTSLKWLNRRSIWTGTHVSPYRHWRHDYWRRLKGLPANPNVLWRAVAPIDRIPLPFKGGLLGLGWGLIGYALNEETL